MEVSAMPRLIHSNPSYRKHRPSGQSVVTLDGQDFYLGPWRSKASRQEYDRLIGEWLANGRRLPRSAGNGAADLSIEELTDRFWAHAQTYYSTFADCTGRAACPNCNKRDKVTIAA
jgi:hypothetical protein